MAKVERNGTNLEGKEDGHITEQDENIESSEETIGEGNIMGNDESDDKINVLQAELDKKESQLNQYIELAQRVKAEFENYKKRTLKEKEQLNTDIKGDIISEFIPVIDNLERAISAETSDPGSILDGVRMISKLFMDILVKQGLEEIEALGGEFDPNFHNAVMHVDDESCGPNTIIEVFQKGYKIKDRVIRHSMVKVAN